MMVRHTLVRYPLETVSWNGGAAHISEIPLETLSWKMVLHTLVRYHWRQCHGMMVLHTLVRYHWRQCRGMVVLHTLVRYPLETVSWNGGAAHINEIHCGWHLASEIETWVRYPVADTFCCLASQQQWARVKQKTGAREYQDMWRMRGHKTRKTGVREY